jgi:hypothetical protein
VAWLAIPISLSWRLNLAVAWQELRGHLINKLDLAYGTYPWASVLVLIPTGAALALAIWRVTLARAPRHLLLAAAAFVAGSELAITITPRASDLGLHWAGSPLAVYYVVVAFTDGAACAILTVACLAWRHAATSLPVRRQPWIIGGYGALLGLVFAPHAMPALGIVLIGFPLAGLARNLYRRVRPRTRRPRALPLSAVDTRSEAEQAARVPRPGRGAGDEAGGRVRLRSAIPPVARDADQGTDVVSVE